MRVEDHEELGRVVCEFKNMLVGTHLYLSTRRRTWYRLRGYLARLTEAHEGLRCVLDDWVSATTLQTYRADLVYYENEISGPVCAWPSHQTVEDGLASYEGELLRRSKKLSQREEVKREIEKFLKLLRSPVYRSEEECLLPPSAPPLPGNFCKRLEEHLRRSDRERIRGRFSDLAVEMQDFGEYPCDGRPIEYYRRYLDGFDTYDLPEKCLDDAWVFFMIPDGRWSARKTHWYFPLHVRLEVRTLLLLGARDPVQCTLACLPCELQHYIAELAASGRAAERPYYAEMKYRLGVRGLP